MDYSADEIKNVLWATFNLEADAIELTDENGGCYKFNVFPNEDSTMDTIASMAEDLYESELFDVTNRGEHLEIEYLNPFILERRAFTIIRENINNWISFEDAQIKRIETLFNQVSIKYHNNQFFPSIMKTLKEKKKLSKKQWEELKFLIDNGLTKYEAGVLSTKN